MHKAAHAWAVLIVVAGGTVAGCSKPEAPGTTPQRADGAPAQQRAVALASQPAGAADPAPQAPANVGDIFPPGPGRDAVLANCASCHNLACAAIGQRTASRWDALKESHKEKVADPDADAAFAYLKLNFSDSKPEPKVPSKFLEGGCTPF